MLDLSHSIRRHRDQLLAAVQLGLSNSKLEELNSNSKIRLINHRATATTAPPLSSPSSTGAGCERSPPCRRVSAQHIMAGGQILSERNDFGGLNRAVDDLDSVVELPASNLSYRLARWQLGDIDDRLGGTSDPGRAGVGREHVLVDPALASMSVRSACGIRPSNPREVTDLRASD
jgi:hypothetical protein